MKKIFIQLFLCFTIIRSAALGEIIETSHFKEILDHIQPNTLVILDVDDTLLLPVQTLGTDVWFQYRLKLHEENGLSKKDALDKALAEWEAVRHLTDVKIVEQGTEKIVEDLQAKNIKVMGLTTQGLALATRTIKQLRSLQIDLTKTAPIIEDCYFMNGQGVLFRDGLLFTAGSPKGPALLKFLEKIGYRPEHILFINDKQAHLKDVESSLIDNGIEFTGLRYSFSDERVENFREEIARIQWTFSSFTHILSDEEAEKFLQPVN